jgi:AraC family transcriptional regulator of adaptative response/methylated-DNA-[protein]-cysteine methyltransferase
MERFSLVRISKSEENDIDIQYNIYETVFGKAVIASTEKGVCYVAFGEEQKMLDELKQRYPKAKLTQNETAFQSDAALLISDINAKKTLSFHVQGTDFQMNVWCELLQIPAGKITTYKTIAERIGHPDATRAVGTAVGRNPVSYFIPCHRVVRTDGGLGGYHWGLDIKKQMLRLEGIFV